jgi:hypothetical protein
MDGDEFAARRKMEFKIDIVGNQQSLACNQPERLQLGVGLAARVRKQRQNGSRLHPCRPTCSQTPRVQ